MGKEKRRSRIPWHILLSIPPSILAILGVVLIIITWLEPDLEAIANGGNWKAPLDVEKELKGIVQVNNTCNDLKKEVVDPKFYAAFPDINDLSCKIIREIEELSPYEADNVGWLRTMYTIEVDNKGDITSNTLILEISDAKYVQYVKYEKKGSEEQNFRDHECRIVPMGQLEPKARIVAKAWVICSVSQEGCFKIRQEGRGDVPLYIKTPVGRVAEWVNKPTHIILVLVLMLFFVSVCCFSTYWMSLKLFRKQSSPAQKQKA